MFKNIFPCRWFYVHISWSVFTSQVIQVLSNIYGIRIKCTRLFGQRISDGERSLIILNTVDYFKNTFFRHWFSGKNKLECLYLTSFSRLAYYLRLRVKRTSLFGQNISDGEKKCNNTEYCWHFKKYFFLHHWCSRQISWCVCLSQVNHALSNMNG